MEPKTLKFRSHLIEEIRAGHKDVTWRLFDDKGLQAGDALLLLSWETGVPFAEAEIIAVREKRLGDVTQDDFVGHEPYTDRDAMLAQYRAYYGDSVSFDTPIKMIGFKVLRFI